MVKRRHSDERFRDRVVSYSGSSWGLGNVLGLKGSLLTILPETSALTAFLDGYSTKFWSPTRQTHFAVVRSRVKRPILIKDQHWINSFFRQLDSNNSKYWSVMRIRLNLGPRIYWVLKNFEVDDDHTHPRGIPVTVVRCARVAPLNLTFIEVGSVA